MAEERILTRKELFDLVWSKPIQHLAREFKLSDVGLAKTCKRYAIPRPERGYWASAFELGSGLENQLNGLRRSCVS